MMEREWAQCAYCADPFTDYGPKPNWEHVIPLDRGGCDHLANLVQACPDCNRALTGLNERGTLTPIEWWARQEWFRDGPEDVTSFDYAGWSQRQRQDALNRAAYWEARARWHLQFECTTNPHGQISPLHHGG